MNLGPTAEYVNRYYFCQSKMTTWISRNSRVFSLVPLLTSWSVDKKEIIRTTHHFKTPTCPNCKHLFWILLKNTKSSMTYLSIFHLELQRPSKPSRECFIAAGQMIATQYPSHHYKWIKSHYFWMLTFLNAFISSIGIAWKWRHW